MSDELEGRLRGLVENQLAELERAKTLAVRGADMADAERRRADDLQARLTEALRAFELAQAEAYAEHCEAQSRERERDAAHAEGRRAGLEEAAKRVDECTGGTWADGEHVAAAIRALAAKVTP